MLRPQELSIEYCKLDRVPAVVSTLTGLTSLACTHDGGGGLSLPGWLSRLANLQELECYPVSLYCDPPDLPGLNCLVSSRTAIWICLLAVPSAGLHYAIFRHAACAAANGQVQ